MRTRTVKNPQTAYTGEMLDSLIAMVAKYDSPIAPEPTGGETKIDEIVEGRLGANFWNLLPDAPRRGRVA